MQAGNYMNSLTEKLAQNPLFGTLGERDQDQLAQIAIRRDYEKDTWIVHEGEVWPYLLWVEQGSITASKKSMDGRTLIAAVIGSGEIFWGMAFFLENEPMPAALKAQIPSRVQLWPRERLLPLLLRNGQMSWALACQLVGRMGQASEIVQELAFQPVTGRLARLLLERYAVNSKNPVPRDLTLDEMAAHIGSTREMVCRALYRFSDEGLIQITRTEFQFKDQAGLEAIAQRGRKG
jgi:CRP/FNR family transcriptional regulator